MSEPNVPAATPATQDEELRALVFSDADGAKKWANSLPLTSLALVCETVQGQLKALSGAAIPAREPDSGAGGRRYQRRDRNREQRGHHRDVPRKPRRVPVVPEVLVVVVHVIEVERQPLVDVVDRIQP